MFFLRRLRSKIGSLLPSPTDKVTAKYFRHTSIMWRMPNGDIKYGSAREPVTLTDKDLEEKGAIGARVTVVYDYVYESGHELPYSESQDYGKFEK